MIYDKIDNAVNYKGLSKTLDNALEFIMNIDVGRLVTGKNEIDGDNLFCMFFEYETKEESEVEYESHQNYIDIQLLLSGNEYIRTTPFETPIVTKVYDIESDIELFALSAGNNLHLKDGYFSLVMPGELHAPGIKYNNKEQVQKLVVKILNN